MSSRLQEDQYDVCIVGSGPAGLACLSAIREPYSLDILDEAQVRRANDFLRSESKRANKQQRTLSVCIVDPHPTWFSKWKQSFEGLKIQHLRSPVMAHPSSFDTNALLAFAVTHGRESELIETGLFDIKSLLPLGQSQIGLWKLPSTKLFNDFCDSETQRLEHDYVQGLVTKVERGCSHLNVEENQSVGCSSRRRYVIYTQNGESEQKIYADELVLAMGPIGKPIIPNFLSSLTESIFYKNVFQWTDINEVIRMQNEAGGIGDILVLGGGLTAVQVAQRVAANTKGGKVVLCSRRPLTCRHFDIHVNWFDRRHANRCMSQFYHLPVKERLALLKETRGGGSVPPLYMEDLRRLENMGKLQRVVGTPKPRFCRDEGDRLSRFDGCAPIRFTIGGQDFLVDAVILACGYKPDCEAHPLVQSIVQNLNPSLQFEGGFPAISEDLQIAEHVYVAGALGSLNTGPDAANLMGIRRAAQIVANNLGTSTSRLRNDGNIFQNRYDIFWSSSSDEDESSSEDE